MLASDVLFNCASPREQDLSWLPPTIDRQRAAALLSDCHRSPGSRWQPPPAEGGAAAAAAAAASVPSSAATACNSTASSSGSFRRNEEACELVEQLMLGRSTALAVDAATGATDGRSTALTFQPALQQPPSPSSAPTLPPPPLPPARSSFGSRLGSRLGALLNRLKPRGRRQRRQRRQQQQRQGGDLRSFADSVRVSSGDGVSPQTLPPQPPSMELPCSSSCEDCNAAAADDALAAVAAADVPDVRLMRRRGRRRSRRRERRVQQQQEQQQQQLVAVASEDRDAPGSAGSTGDAPPTGQCDYLTRSPIRGLAEATVGDLCYGGSEFATAHGDWTTDTGCRSPMMTSSGMAANQRGAAMLPAGSPASMDTFDHRRRLSRLGLTMAIGFQPVGLQHGWSALVTALPAQENVGSSKAHFDWSISGDACSDYLAKAVFVSAADAVATAPADDSQDCQPKSSSSGTSNTKRRRQLQKRRLMLIKYPLSGQPIQLLPTRSKSAAAAAAATAPEAATARLLTPQAETEVPCSGRLSGLFCTAGFVTLAIRLRDNLELRVYSSDRWHLATADCLMRNERLAKEAAAGVADVANEKVQCLTVDKAEQLVMYYHSFRVLSTGRCMRRLCCLSLPGLQLCRRLALKDDVKSIKVGTKYFALYFADCRLTVYCKSSRAPVFDFSGQRLSSLFQGDTFEMDSQDRLVEVSEQRVRSLFYNGVTYRDCSCANLQELSKRSLIGRRVEFYEAVECHLATLRLAGQSGGGGGGGGKAKAAKAGACRVRLRSNHKLLRRLEEVMCRGGGGGGESATSPRHMPVVVCESAFWLETVPEPGYKPPGLPRPYSGRHL